MATIKPGMTGGFASSIRLHADLAMERVNDKVYEIARELFTSIVNLTPSPTNKGPTATGVLVNNWFPVDGAGYSESKTDAKSPNGAASLSRIRSLRGRQFLHRDGVVTLSNNIHYAYRAEVLGWPIKDGWSGKIGPYRMVAKSLQAVAARYK